MSMFADEIWIHCLRYLSLERRFWEDVVAAAPSEATSLIIVEW
jgi:hypothetical protein